MNDIEFQQLAHANPRNDSPEFRQAMNENPERAALVASLLALDDQLAASLKTEVPDTLKARLLKLPAQQQPVNESNGKVHSLNPPSNRFPSYRMLLPLAAVVVLAVAVTLNLLPPATNRAIASSTMEHLYAELALLDAEGEVSVSEMNEHLQEFGGAFTSSPGLSSLEASVLVDCWIEKEQQHHFHLVFMGQEGPATLIVMEGESVSSDATFDDERFDGYIKATPHGNLIVAGEKGERVEELAAMFAENISW